MHERSLPHRTHGRHTRRAFLAIHDRYPAPSTAAPEVLAGAPSSAHSRRRAPRMRHTSRSQFAGHGRGEPSAPFMYREKLGTPAQPQHNARSVIVEGDDK